MNLHFRTLVVSCGAMFLAACASSPRIDTSAEGARLAPGWMGNVYLTAGPPAPQRERIFVLVYRVDASGVNLVSADILHGTPSRLPQAHKDFIVELLDSQAGVVATYGAPDPRQMIVEQQGNVAASDGLLTLRLAFDQRVVGVQVRDSSGKVVAKSDLSDARRKFCGANHSDRNCLDEPQGNRTG